MGRSVEKLVINNWRHTRQWPYILLSRVRTMDGLFLNAPLSKSISYTIPTELREIEKLLKDEKKPMAFEEGFDENEIYNNSCGS